jgi:putative transposase
MRWLYSARQRYGLCVLDYIVTSNHIDLLVRDQGRGETARSMQLIAGRSAQEYNERKGRRGAFLALMRRPNCEPYPNRSGCGEPFGG